MQVPYAVCSQYLVAVTAFVIDNIVMFLTNTEVYMVNTRPEPCIHKPFFNLNCVGKRSLLTIQDPHAN